MIDFEIQTSYLYKTNWKLPENITYRLCGGKKTQHASYEKRKHELPAVYAMALQTHADV